MARTFVFSDFAQAQLAAPVLAAATTIPLGTGQGALFPSPGGTEQFALILREAGTGSPREIVYCTGRTTDTLTVIRAQEGTSAQDWDTGTPCFHGPTAGTMEAFAQTAAANGRAGYWVAGGSANALTITPSPAFDAYFTGMAFLVEPSANNSGAATLDVNGLGTKDIRDPQGVALVANMLKSGQFMRMVYTAGGYFKIEASAPVSSFITTLTTVSPLTGTEEVPVSSGGAAGKTTMNAIANFSQQTNLLNSFMLGMMGGN